MLLQRELTIGSRETSADLEPRLARLGADVLAETVRGLADGLLAPTPQDGERATLAPLLTKEDGRLDWERSAAELDCRIRGFHPWPGAYTSLGGRTLKVRRAQPVPPPAGETDGAPGTVLAVGGDGLVVACGDRTRLLLVEVQPESRRAMDAAAFAAGARLRPGDRLG